MLNTLDLGPLIDTYQTRHLQFHNFWDLILWGFLLILCPTIVGLYNFYSGYTQYGPVAGYAWGMPWLIFALILFAAWLLVFFLRLRIPRFTIQLYKNGLRFEGKAPANKVLGTDGCLNFESLDGISVETIGKNRKKESTASGIASQRVWLFLIDGKKISLSEAYGQPGGLIELPELASRIKACLYPRLALKYKTDFQLGRCLSFGPLHVQKEGLRFQGKPGDQNSEPIPWGQIHHMTVKAGYLVVELGKPSEPTNQTKRFPVSRVPNLELMIQLIKENVEG
jgi:hypothetical protein